MLVLLAALVLLGTSPVRAGNWPQWRGPAFNGSSDETGLPDHWSKTENIAWSAPLPGAAAATPIVWDDCVFLSGVDATKDALQAMCFERRTGRLLWTRDVAQGAHRDHRSNYASGSPASDGRRAVFLYGNGELVCYDFAGRQQWKRNLENELGPFCFYWTPACSPLLHGGTLYIALMQRDVPVRGRGRADRENVSFLLALDPASGKTLWQHVRPSRAANESHESYTTPIPVVVRGQTQLLVCGGDALTAHDPATGKEFWRWDGWNPQRKEHWPQVASPVTGAGVALVCVPKGQPVYAVKIDGAGTLDEQAVAWSSRKERQITSEVPTPAFYDGDFFILSESKKALTRVEARTGKVKWTVRTPGSTGYEASPLAADGKIYLINWDGQVAILSAATGEVLRTISMDQPADGELVRASIVASHGQLFIRTTRRLYCVGKPASAAKAH